MKRTLLVLSLIGISIQASCFNAEPYTAEVPAAPPTPIEKVPPEIPEQVVVDVRLNHVRPVFHETIDKRTKSAGIGRLREIVLEENDLEVRIWGGFGLTVLQGFVLKRVNNAWSATHLDSDYRNGRFVDTTTKLNPPARGWETVWQSLKEHRILSLPSSGDIGCDAMAEDGFSYVVEIRKGESYRTYHYDNPAVRFENRCAEADEILAIGKIISKDFGIDAF